MKKIDWSSSFLVLDAAQPALPQIQQVDRGNARWVVIVAAGPAPRVYVLSRDEFFRCLRATTVPYSPRSRASLRAVFALQGLRAATVVPARSSAAAARTGLGGGLPTRLEATGPHLVKVAGGDWAGAASVLAVGTPATGARQRAPAAPAAGARRLPVVKKAAAKRAAPAATLSAPSTTGSAPPITRAKPPAPPASRVTRGAPPQSAPEMTGVEPDEDADEGTTPMRFPSIEPKGPVQAGAPITLVVDLLREESASTVGGTMFPEQAADWQSFEVDVLLQSPDIDFDAGGRATLQVRRNADSLAASLNGRVHAGLPSGHAIEVKARFMLGTRFCGSAARRLLVDGLVAPAEPTPAAMATVQLDADARQPDLTVYIGLFEQDKPGRLHWRMVLEPFAKCPPKLDGVVDLGQKPELEASQLFKQFAKLERGAHREAIEGFGEELWRKSPPEFQAVYWALCDELQRPLTIQFVSDDPHLPWELMNPYRDGEQHGPIALRHAVARWIARFAGYMRNRLPTGRLVAVAPHYASASAQLSLAEAAAQGLVDKLGAQRVAGTRTDLLALLENPPPEPVALLFFTGHGAFAAEAAGASLIKLEDGGELSALEVGRQKVRLGERDGTVVFLNACEVGATGSVLGNVGGWAGAFLGRRFGAFIAPLWAIDEEDAQQVTEELMRAIVTQRQPMGEALRDLRAAHGDVSPTFYSYLLYGDVTARVKAA